MNLIFNIYFFIVGLVVGSFCCVVGLRIPKGTFLISKRSFCPSCKQSLSWFELLPIVSYLLQKGRCRHCGFSIPYLYLVIELFTGSFFAYSFSLFGFGLELVLACTFISLMSIVIVTDITYMIIPDRILLFFLPLFIILRVIGPLNPWWSAFAGSIVGLVLLACIILVSRGGMGGGDMKLLGLFGIVLGVKGVLIAFFLACILGTIISWLLLYLKQIDRKKPFPFGPFLVFGALTSYLYSDLLWRLYVDMLY
jgi:leader peptidase (prepilin peptidase)/N-methyltransferase